MKADLAPWQSIRFRLTAWYTGILMVTFALAGVFILFAVRDAAEETIDNDLRARLAAVREYLPTAVGSDQNETLEEHFAVGPGGAWLQIADTGGHWLYRSDLMENDDTPPPSPASLTRRGKTRTLVIHGKSLRILTAPLPGRIVQLGIPMGEFDEMYQQLHWALFVAAPLLLFLACGGGYWMSGRALRGVGEIEKTVRRIGSHNLRERLHLRGAGDELDRLSITINQMLERVESAFRLIVQFTADASHELRTPVAIIRTTGEVIRQTRRTPEEHEEAWDHVVVQTERVSKLVDDLLLLARADAGYSDVVFEPIDLAEIVADVSHEMKVLSDASGLTLTYSVPDDCPIEGDAEAMRRLLLILLDNAIKDTPAGGGVVVHLYVDKADKDGRVVIDVYDTGIGIETADLPRIFDRFYRVSKDRSRKTGGSGLGLAIAKWLVSRHDGDIAVQSTVGDGSRFRISLPSRREALKSSSEKEL